MSYSVFHLIHCICLLYGFLWTNQPLLVVKTVRIQILLGVFVCWIFFYRLIEKIVNVMATTRGIREDVEGMLRLWSMIPSGYADDFSTHKYMENQNNWCKFYGHKGTCPFRFCKRHSAFLLWESAFKELCPNSHSNVPTLGLSHRKDTVAWTQSTTIAFFICRGETALWWNFCCKEYWSR